jgi:hypothetical protein
MLKVLEGLPAKMGFRMPAEWEPHEQCWMGWPVRTRSPLPASPSPIRLSYSCCSFHSCSSCFHFGVGAPFYGVAVAAIRVLCCDAGI